MRTIGLRVLARVPAAVCVLVMAAAPAVAQTADGVPANVNVSHVRIETAPDRQSGLAPPAAPRTAEHHVLAWTVELDGGLVGTWAPVRGFGTLPAGGADFVTESNVVSPSGSSWYLGRGAAWLNHYAKPVSTSLQVTPLDPLLTTASAIRQRGPAYGVRVTREISQRLDVDLVVDRAESQFVAAPSVLSSLQTTSASFSSVWNGLLGGLPRSSATSQLGGTDTYGHRTLATAALDYFLSFGRVTPYVALGGGVAANSGSVEATLTGDVQFQVNTFAEHQTDSVDVVFGEKRWEPVAVIGAGLVAQLNRRIGVRLDLRSNLVGSGLRTTVSATPGIASGSGLTDLVNSTGLAIQFNPASTPASTLGVPVTNATTFTGTGWHKQLSATFGCFFRF